MAESHTRSKPPGFPDRVGRYELLLPIGTGGMATVFLARSQGVGGFQRDVALKLIHAHLRADEESKLQLIEEARLAARIRHPNVVPVLEVGEDPFGVFLVMDYVEGETLSGLSRAAAAAGRTIPTPLVARILNDALAGLHAAHELRDERGEPLGLVHRDFSPQNILVGTEGIARLSDFGIAKSTSRAVRTKTGLVKGKIAYMSPEQARGRTIDRRCDVWAAGIVAWELLAGRSMHSQDDDVATLLKIVTEEPPRLRHAGAKVSKELEAVVASALTPDPAHRCATAEQFRKHLLGAWGNAGIAEPSELAQFVKETVADKLAERRHAVEEVRTLRARMVELVRPAYEDARTLATPGRAQPDESAPRNPLPEVEPSASAQGDDAGTLATALASESSSSPAIESTEHSLPITPRSRRAAVAGMAAVALVAAVAFATGQRSSAPRGDLTPAQPPAPQAASRLLAPLATSAVLPVTVPTQGSGEPATRPSELADADRGTTAERTPALTEQPTVKPPAAVRPRRASATNPRQSARREPTPGHTPPAETKKPAADEVVPPSVPKLARDPY